MTQTITKQYTYTVADVSKAFESFRSDLRLFSATSGVEEELVDARADDVLAFARAKYLTGVHVRLHDAAGGLIRAARYTVSENASGWKSEMPGDNFWPSMKGGRINIVVTFNDTWHSMSESSKQKFRDSLSRPWGPSDADLSYNDMEVEGSRNYASNAYGLQHTNYRRKS
jgi:hypothetical protein